MSSPGKWGFLPGWGKLVPPSPEPSARHSQAGEHLRTEHLWAAWLGFRMPELQGSREARGAPGGQAAAGMPSPERRCRGKSSTRLCLVLLHPGTSRLQTPPAWRRSTACQRAGHPGSRRLYAERHQMVCYETVWSENSCGFLVPGRTGEAARGGEP